jgi:ATP phosphoribosyltransferase
MANKAAKDELVLGIPKGSLQESTLKLFRRAGYDIHVPSRSYFPTVDDEAMSAVMFRAQEMSRYVEEGIVDVGLTGHDWVCENNSDVVEVCELVYSKATSKPAKWILAVPEEGNITKPEELEGGIVATELMNVTKKYFADKGINVKVEFSWGATEVKARMLDGIVDVTETGSSLRANKLRVIDTLLTSTPRLIANKEAMEIDWKRQKIENIAMLLTGAIQAQKTVGLKLNAPAEALEKIIAILPAEKSPTVSHLADKNWVAVEVILEEKVERELVPQLKRAGASGLITYPLNKVIH